MADGDPDPSQTTGRDCADTGGAGCWTGAAFQDKKASRAHPNCRPNCLPGCPSVSDAPAIAGGELSAEVASPWPDSVHLESRKDKKKKIVNLVEQVNN